MFVMFTLGNGYRCSCCRTSRRDDIDGTLEEVIAYCIKEAKRADWDFSVYQVRECEEDQEFAIEEQIENAVKLAEKREKHATDVKRLEDQIKDVDRWFNTLEQQKQDKDTERMNAQAKLAALLS